MTWDKMIGKIREGLNESGAHLRTVGKLVAEVSEDEDAFNDELIGAVVALLALAVSNLHSAVEHMGIGLDAVVEAMCEASGSQEVKGD